MTQPEPKQPRRARWQISLREVMFLTVALCAVLALVIQTRPFRTTSFFDSFDAQTILQAVEVRTKISTAVPSHGGGYSIGDNRAVRDHEAYFHSPPSANPGLIVAEFRKEVEMLLKQHGCHIHGRGGDPADNDISAFSAFSFDYEHGNTDGDIYVNSYTDANNSWRLTILIHEFKK